jgi:hypothetical protein
MAMASLLQFEPPRGGVASLEIARFFAQLAFFPRRYTSKIPFKEQRHRDVYRQSESMHDLKNDIFG